jgi:hypothetical protein
LQKFPPIFSRKISFPPYIREQVHRSLANSDALFRRKRSLAEFEAELEGCDSKRCTVLKCRVGPLEKDESVLFRVRSRLFTETQVKVNTINKNKQNISIEILLLFLLFQKHFGNIPCAKLS